MLYCIYKLYTSCQRFRYPVFLYAGNIKHAHIQTGEKITCIFKIKGINIFRTLHLLSPRYFEEILLDRKPWVFTFNVNLKFKKFIADKLENARTHAHTPKQYLKKIPPSFFGHLFPQSFKKKHLSAQNTLTE